MPKFSIDLRAIKHVTARVTIEAETENEAHTQALERFELGEVDSWSESDAEDLQVESVTKESGNV